jgi:hypothetical protein
LKLLARGEFWPGKNHKYFKKRKLFMEYQSIVFKIFRLEKFVLILKYLLICYHYKH